MPEKKHPKPQTHAPSQTPEKARPADPLIDEGPTAKRVAGEILQEQDRIAQLEAENAALKAPKGIPAIADPNAVPRNADGTVKRPDQVLKEIYNQAIQKNTTHLTDIDRVAIEREIRRYVRKGGPRKNPVDGEIVRDANNNPVMIPPGYRHGIPEHDRKKCDILLKMLGRVDETGTPIPSWEESILVPGMSASVKNQTAR